MQLDSNSLIMQWNTDINGNPVSKHIAREVQQTSPTHNLIQLTQIPDEFYPLRIVTEDNVELKEVKYRNDITETTFCVDYGMGLVYFDKSLSGKFVIINYYGRGVMLISDSRIFHKNGDTIADTWDNIIERSQDALDLIEHSGGLAGAIKIIDQKVEEGTKVADRLEDFITETQFYGYTITLSREAFVVKADDNGEVGKTETSSVYTDVVVYQGAKQIIPTLNITDEYGCTFKVVGQRVSLATIDVNLIKVNAVLNIDCGDGLVAKRVLEVTKVFDGVNQYQVSMTNPFYSFQANSEGYIEEEQSVECSFNVSKANVEYDNYTVQVQNLPQGLNYKINKGSVVFTAITGRLLPSSGSCSVVVTIDGQSFNKPFTWNKTNKGQDAKSLTLVGNQIIRYEKPDYSDIPLQINTTISAKIVGLSGTPTWSFFNGYEWVVLENEIAMDLTFAHNDATIWADRKEVTIKCELEGFYDELTIVKLANGTNGNDAITVVLTNESHTVAIDDSGYVESSEIENTRTNVLAYKGANSVTPKVTKGKCVGCDVTITGATVQLASLDNSFTSSTAELLVEVDGVIITKVWTISKSKQGLQGQSGQNGKSYILNVTGGSRSVVYSQINQDPRPSLSSTFNGALYEDGVEVLEGVSWYWLANGHFEGTSINSDFTPTIKKVFDESVINNSISVMATYKGQILTQEIPLSVTKDAYGLDWVSEWDDTKVDVRGNLILTPKIFAGHYDQENDLVTGVAIGQDVLNNGRTIGVVGYQNNIPSFLLDTDGSLQVGNPFGEDSTGLYYNNGVFKLKVNELSIEGAKVPTENEIGNLVTSEVNSAKNEIQESINGLNNSLGSLEDVVNNSLRDGILTEVEKQSLKTVMDTLTNEMNTLLTQVGSVLVNPFLSNIALMQQLQTALEEYQNTYDTLLEVYTRIVSTDTPTDEDSVLFNDTILQLSEKSEILNQLLIDCLTDISQAQAQQLVDKAKEEIQAEVSDVNDALADLENTINGDFKAGLITSINIANLENQLQQLAKEKADLDSQYNVIYNNANLSTTIKSKLLQAKSNYDIAHDTLVAKINSAIADNLMTEQELQEINALILAYTEKLGLYSGVAQEANADIALNSAQAVVEALDQEAIFNKLTNNGEVQGIYLQDGKVYINGEYVNTRNLKAVKDDGTETFKIDSQGNVSIKANSFTLTGDATTNVATKDYVDASISNVEFDETDLTQEGVFNALTNNGQTQGIYLDNSKLYINGEYIQTGTIRADLVKVAVDGKENILPFNYVTFKSGIESWLNIDETNEGIPFIEAEMPIYQGGGSNSYFCRKLGSSTVYLEPNTRYFFSCDIYAYVPRDGVETYGVGGSTGTGAELTLMTAMSERYVTEGRYVPIFIINSLATETTEGQWTRKVYEFTTPAESEFYSLSNHMYIELNGSNYNTGSYGYVQIANMALEKAVEGQVTASTFDYLTQLKERRIDLSDDKFYHTRLSVDGFSTEEGIIEGTTSTDGHDYKLNYDGLNVYKSPRERYFVGKDKAYYSYTAGSSGVISGHSDIYGVGGVHLNANDEYAGYRGIFTGVHYGYQIPNTTTYGRPDIYVHNGQWGLDYEEWQLLGEVIEPRGLVRRDDSKNITTNHQLKFLVGGGTNTANVWNQEQYNTTGNGQMLTYSAGKVYVSNPQTPLVLESSVDPVVKVGSASEQKIIHAGNLTDRGVLWGVARCGSSNVADLNNLWRSGFYDICAGNNAPGGSKDWWWVMNSAHTSNSEGYKYGMQIACQNVSSSIWFRTTNQYGVGTWYRFYHTGYQQTSTSDIRYKRALSPINTDSCYDMVKNININSYLLLDEGIEDEYEVDRAFLRATQEEGISRKLQMGVIAQDLLKYDFGEYVVVQDVTRDEETGEITNDKYSIDAYNYASAILGGLQKEIQIRDEQYEELKQENEELKAKVDSLEQRLAKIEALLGQE